MPIPPLTKEDVPFRKIRAAINRIVEQVNRQRPITDGPVELLENGFRVKESPPGGGAGYTPPFSPIISNEDDTTYLAITKGHVFVPTGSTAEKEIQHYPIFPYMPLINGLPLDSALDPKIPITRQVDNYVWLEINLDQITANIGSYTFDDGSNEGIQVLVDYTEADGTEATNHNHEAIALAENCTYKFNGVPQFKVDSQLTEFPWSTDTLINIPWGKVVVDADGNQTTDGIWYRTGDFDFFPQTYVRSYNDGTNPGFGTPEGDRGMADDQGNQLNDNNGEPFVLAN